jgi:hypothetical protein
MNTARWKTVGVTVGIVSVIGGGATAYAWSGSSARASAPLVSSVSAHDVAAAVSAAKTARQHIGAEKAVDWIAAITSRLEDRVNAFGTPSTLTPREAEHLRDKIRFVGFLQDKAADLSAAGTTGAAALQTRLATLKNKLSSIMANATVVKPFVDTVTRSGTAAAFGGVDPDRHHCDGHHYFGGAAGSGGFDSYGGHHDYYGHDRHYEGSRR